MEPLILGLLVLAVGPYPGMAPAEQYRMAAADEISMARSAAPPAISGHATVLVLGAHGYDEVAKGRNGFVCLVARSWATDLGDAEFWNPKIRAPICYNPPAARSVLPGYLRRTRAVLAGRAPVPSGGQPEVASMSYMLSPRGYLADKAGHWLPHLMFYLPKTDGAAWGADVAGSPVVVHVSDTEPVTVFMVPVRRWSDGSAP